MTVRAYHAAQRQLFGYQAGDRLPEDDICFLVDDVIEDLELVPAARGNAVVGAPVYEPRMILKVLCLGYVRAIVSSRRLEAECVENIRFIHLCRGDRPSYRTISRFRSENKALVESAFSSVVRMLVEAKLAGGRHVVADGTKIRADASNKKVFNRRFFELLKAAFERWMSESESADAQDELAEQLRASGVCKSDVPADVAALGEFAKKCLEAGEEGGKDGVSRVSLTDNESRFMKDAVTGKIGLSYNVQAVVDAESGMIVGCDVTNEANDAHSLCGLVDEAQKNSGEPVEAVDADSGFFEAGQVRALEALGKDVCVADGQTKSALNKGKLAEFLAGERFEYNSERDVFTCPFGNEHVFKRVCKRKGGRVARVYQSVQSCAGCPERSRCLGKSRSRLHKLERTIDHPWLHQYRQRFLLDEYQERLRRRGIIERVFGHWKHNLGFRRFRLRGLCGAKTEAVLMCLASVLRRTWNILKRTGRKWRDVAWMGRTLRPEAA